MHPEDYSMQAQAAVKRQTEVTEFSRQKTKAEDEAIVYLV